MKILGRVASTICLGLVASCGYSQNSPDAPTNTVKAQSIELASSSTQVSVPGETAPILALPGEFEVGVTSILLTNPDQPDIANFNYSEQENVFYDRQIPVDIFYPAASNPNLKKAVYTGHFVNPAENPVADLPETFEIIGNAFRNAPPLSDTTFPLVIVSHGLANTPGVLASLTENIASKGYVVAVIDHGDFVPTEQAAAIKMFQRALLYRSSDQQFVLSELTLMSRQEETKWASLIDPNNTALIGFSMGGYGVMNHAGAGYNSEAQTYKFIAGDNLAPFSAGDPRFSDETPSNINAIIGIAPWGAHSDVAMWDNSAFANITAPLMLIVGSQDDIVGYEDGVGSVFEHAINADRYMLVFQNAMHNLAQVAAPAIARKDVRVWANFEDPVWQRQKIHEINQHFVTAFLDLHLKQVSERQTYLDVPTVASNDGQWPQPMGRDFSADYADGTGPSAGYWKGFKRRQAIGLEMHRLPAQNTPEALEE